MASEEYEVGDIPLKKKKSKKSSLGAVAGSGGKTKSNRAARIKKAAADAAAVRKERPEVVEEKPEKKKKKKKIRIRKSERRENDKKNLVDSADTNIENDTVDQLTSSFEQLVERIPNALEEEQEQIGQYRLMFNNLCTMTRTLERSFQAKPTDRTMYAIIKAYGELREIIADMRALADFSQHSEMIRQDIINPFAEACAAGLVEYHKAVAGLLRSQIDPGSYRLVESKLKGFAQQAGVSIAENQRVFQNAAEQMFAPGKK